MPEPEKPTGLLYQFVKANYDAIGKIRAELKALREQLAKLPKESETSDAEKTKPGF